MPPNKLDYKNDWESDNYLINGKPVANITSVLIDGKDYSVTNRVVTVPYNDMGKPCVATSRHFFVEEFVFGMRMRFDLNKIVKSVSVIAVEFDYA